jgi:hypothetical protein
VVLIINTLFLMASAVMFIGLTWAENQTAMELSEYAAPAGQSQRAKRSCCANRKPRHFDLPVLIQVLLFPLPRRWR